MCAEALKVFSMDDKAVIITGGAGFFGMQFAEILSQAGATVVIFDRVPAAELEECRKAIHRVSGKDSLAIQVDITMSEDVKNAVTWVYKKLGRIDVLINNAALNPMVGNEDSKDMFSPYEIYPPDLFMKELVVDVMGAFFCIQAVVPYMAEQRDGVIVNLASEYANIAADNRIYGEGKFKSIAYITAKSGILGLTRGMASYLGKYNVRVNALTPGGMPRAEVPEEFRKHYSSLNMLGRMAEFNEYNGAILFLCSKASSFMTGAQLIVDGGKTAW